MKISTTIRDIQAFFVRNRINPLQAPSDLYLIRTIKTIGRLAAFIGHPESRILDLGCGNGLNTVILSTLLPDAVVVGLDVGIHRDNWKSLGEQHYTPMFVAGDARKLPFHTEEFDMVIMWGLLEHIGEAEDGTISRPSDGQEAENGYVVTLQEIGRVLKPGGVLSVNYLPNAFSYIESLTRFSKLYSHPKKFTRTEISQLLRDTGFVPRRTECVHFVPSLYFSFGERVGRFLNRRVVVLERLDDLVLRTPARFFSQDLEIQCVKSPSEALHVDEGPAKRTLF